MLKLVQLCGESLCVKEAAISIAVPFLNSSDSSHRIYLCPEHYKKLQESAAAIALPLDDLDVQPIGGRS